MFFFISGHLCLPCFGNQIDLTYLWWVKIKAPRTFGIYCFLLHHISSNITEVIFLKFITCYTHLSSCMLTMLFSTMWNTALRDATIIKIIWQKDNIKHFWSNIILFILTTCYSYTEETHLWGNSPSLHRHRIKTPRVPSSAHWQPNSVTIARDMSIWISGCILQCSSDDRWDDAGASRNRQVKSKIWRSKKQYVLIMPTWTY